MVIVINRLLLLWVAHVCSQTTEVDRTSRETAGGGDYVFFQSREKNQHTASLKPPTSIQCIGVMRGLFLTAGTHLEPRIEAIGGCPLDTPAELVDLCSTDVPKFPPEAGTVEDLQNHLLEQLHSKGRPNLGVYINLAISKVSPVIDSTTGVIYANTYCAQCHGANSTSKQIQKLRRQLFCDRVGLVSSCFVYTDIPEHAKRCFAAQPGPRFQFDWDSIFTLPDDDYGGESDEASEKTPMDFTFEILQWLCCVFSLVTLLVAICVFLFSPRLRRPMPGKMMIALCLVLLGALVSFLLASGVMDALDVSPRSTHLRPMCVTFAGFLLVFLLAVFVWMALFGVELFRTFGLIRMFRQFVVCRGCRTGGRGNHDSKTGAAGFMLRARGSKSNSATRFRRHLQFACLLPLCFAVSALVINEYAYHILTSVDKAPINTTRDDTTEEVELGPVLYHLNPAFCPMQDTRRAWFTGHKIALLTWFLGPAGSMITFNLVTLFIVCVQICRLKRESQLSPPTPTSFTSSLSPRKQSKSLVSVCAKLAVILGASWFLQLFAGMWPQLRTLRRIAGLMNCAQGGMIAISMLAGTKARRVMASWLPNRCREAMGVSEVTSRTTREMTTSSSRSKERLDQV